MMIASHFQKILMVPDTVIWSLHTFDLHGSLWYIRITPNFQMRENECQKRLNDLLKAVQLVSGRGGIVHPDLFFPKSIHLTLICLDANITHMRTHTVMVNRVKQCIYRVIHCAGFSEPLLWWCAWWIHETEKVSLIFQACLTKDPFH